METECICNIAETLNMETKSNQAVTQHYSTMFLHKIGDQLTQYLALVSSYSFFFYVLFYLYCVVYSRLAFCSVHYYSPYRFTEEGKKSPEPAANCPMSVLKRPCFVEQFILLICNHSFT